ncbi:MAG: DUF4870 domain-containing protein [Patescibacteria group bacterium]|nr:DUF4870 domain-containing protein [Patescibacteria group bacterium]
MAEQTATSASPNRTNALLAWIFAPLTSFIFLNDEDAFTKKCAKHSMYFGIASIVMYIVLSVLATISFGILSCLVLVWVAVDLIVRIMGAVKANSGELFEVPVISGMVKE